jgi:hypothetical protein
MNVTPEQLRAIANRAFTLGYVPTHPELEVLFTEFQKLQDSQVEKAGLDLLEQHAKNMLPNGLTLLQTNPDCAARLDPEARDHGWLYIKGADGQWVTHRKLANTEIEEAYDQVAMLREALAAAYFVMPTTTPKTIRMIDEALAATSDDWRRKHDAEVLRKFSEAFLISYPAFRGELSAADRATGEQWFSVWIAAQESSAGALRKYGYMTASNFVIRMTASQEGEKA